MKFFIQMPSSMTTTYPKSLSVTALEHRLTELENWVIPPYSYSSEETAETLETQDGEQKPDVNKNSTPPLGYSRVEVDAELYITYLTRVKREIVTSIRNSISNDNEVTQNDIALYTRVITATQNALSKPSPESMNELNELAAMPTLDLNPGVRRSILRLKEAVAYGVLSVILLTLGTPISMPLMLSMACLSLSVASAVCAASLTVAASYACSEFPKGKRTAYWLSHLKTAQEINLEAIAPRPMQQ